MENRNHPEVIIFDNGAELAQETARRFQAIAIQAVQQNGRFTVALAGGQTPRATYGLLTHEPYTTELPWEQCYFFFGDERCVPPTHPDSNFNMAEKSLLSKANIPRENIFRMQGELNPEQAAQRYSELLQHFFRMTSSGGPSPENFPPFDLVLLGMGSDGHTASLFPGTAALQERSRPTVANYVTKTNSFRLTLTAPAINRAANIIFMIEGADKAAPVRQVLEGEYQPQIYPSQLIRPGQGRLTFLLDRAAAAQLKAVQT